MEIPKLLILLCCAYCAFASHEGHYTIPVENYETELHDLGEHVDIPETPVRVVKITKTVAVKVPVPYPVKVIEKVPYPVHISKPYPVPVPHIVKVPHVESPQPLHGHEALGGSGGSHFPGHQDSYQVQEAHSHDAPSAGNSYESFNGEPSIQPNKFQHYNDYAAGLSDHSYDVPSSDHYVGTGYNHGESSELNAYDEGIINNFLKKITSDDSAGNGLLGYNSH